MMTTFLYSLAGGMMVILATGRVEQIAWKFLRLIGTIVLTLAAGTTAWQLRETGDGAWEAHGVVLPLAILLGLSGIVVVFLAPFSARWPRLFRLACVCGGSAGLAAACVLAGGGLNAAGGGVAGMLLGATSQTLGGLVVGSLTVAWLLGHAYLTATEMTIAPLRHFSRMLSWAVGARILFMLVSLALAWMLGGGEGGAILSRLLNQWIVVSLRVGLGLIALGLFAYMVSDCVRRRATQSATGILYFGSIFAYVGELASQYLVTECGWPV